jgi:hypothetical protein
MVKRVTPCTKTRFSVVDFLPTPDKRHHNTPIFEAFHHFEKQLGFGILAKFNRKFWCFPASLGTPPIGLLDFLGGPDALRFIEDNDAKRWGRSSGIREMKARKLVHVPKGRGQIVNCMANFGATLRDVQSKGSS